MLDSAPLLESPRAVRTARPRHLRGLRGGLSRPTALPLRLCQAIAMKVKVVTKVVRSAKVGYSRRCGSQGSAFVRCGRRRFGHPLCWRVRVSCPLFPLLDCRRVVGVMRLLPSAIVCFLSCFGGATCAVVARSRLCDRRFGGGAPRCACGLYRFPAPPLAPSDAPQGGAGAPFSTPVRAGSRTFRVCAVRAARSLRASKTVLRG